MKEVYTTIIIALRENKTKADILSTSENLCREYHSLQDCLAVLDLRNSSLLTIYVIRLVVPTSHHQSILKILHLAPQGVNKTYMAARLRYYWL